jgi:hypothetical protein
MESITISQLRDGLAMRFGITTKELKARSKDAYKTKKRLCSWARENFSRKKLTPRPKWIQMFQLEQERERDFIGRFLQGHYGHFYIISKVEERYKNGHYKNLPKFVKVKSYTVKSSRIGAPGTTVPCTYNLTPVKDLFKLVYTVINMPRSHPDYEPYMVEAIIPERKSQPPSLNYSRRKGAGGGRGFNVALMSRKSFSPPNMCRLEIY